MRAAKLRATFLQADLKFDSTSQANLHRLPVGERRRLGLDRLRHELQVAPRLGYRVTRATAVKELAEMSFSSSL
jgi:hypothetical protein